MKFGIAAPHGLVRELTGIKDPVEAYETMTNVVRTAEEVGFNSIWTSDAFWPDQWPWSAPEASQPEQEFLFECWTTTAALARDTSRVRIGQMATNNLFRHPALLAKMASTIDVISHGRLTLGIGSGTPTFAPQLRAYYGEDYPPNPVLFERLRESVQILHAMWTQEEATFEGKHYQVSGAINQPKGVQLPHIPLLIAGGGEQVTLKLVAQYGDACNLSGDPATIRRKLEVLKRHCKDVGRDYESIHNTVGLAFILADTDEQALAQVPEAIREFVRENALIGSPATIRKRITGYEEAGVHELIFRLPEPLNLDTLRRFAQEFIA
ncbi:LLM class F420-dependent oxidoreductase [Reticulibacter mediterranei]|uniref:LLM class F420-dependent oxidoreductase n=1 Tax=Reticulibacter mediterranei TaxID=2778369 RepID=A0A8J3IS29_9CHLR|nr:TIGR03560 family F420-dependent LLM class oxidoreductase [Reticulibacter mediterranei]GHO99363.1 LLM class F420-dependent oxidoreductase [Reticulibacter mediterranei]